MYAEPGMCVECSDNIAPVQGGVCEECAERRAIRERYERELAMDVQIVVCRECRGLFLGHAGWRSLCRHCFERARAGLRAA